MTVMAAGDEAELVHMIATAAGHDDGPMALRYPRGEGMGVTMPERGTPLQIGKGRVLREGSDVALLSFGAHLSEVLAAATILEAEGIHATVADARFAKPLDHALIDQLYRNHQLVVTIEQGSTGGFGALVLHYLAASGALDRRGAVRTMTLPDRFIDQASPGQMYAWAGLAAGDIASTVRQVVLPARTGGVVSLR
jgi:1-deoxy-D-xylulose-5-phosphate synthase